MRWALLLTLAACSDSETTDPPDSNDSTPDSSDSSDSNDSSSDTGSQTTEQKVFILPVQFSDQTAGLYPTKAEVDGWLNSQKIHDYYDTSSYGEAVMTITTEDWWTHPKTSAEVIDSGGYVLKNADFFNNIDVTIDGFDPNAYEEHLVLFVPFDIDMHGFTPGSITYTGSGPAEYNITVNGVTTNAHIFLSHNLKDFHEPRSYAITWYDYETQTAGIEEGDVSGETIPLNKLEATYVHEMGHKLGISAHAQTWTNHERRYFEPEHPSAAGKVNYGNTTATMGTSASWAFALHSTYRNFLGWGDSQMDTIPDDTKKTVTIHPINTHDHTTMARYVTDHGFEYGFYLEVREADDWHSFMQSKSRLSSYFEGVLIHYRYGDNYNPTDYLLDASPGPKGQYNKADITDVALKPGMEAHFPRLSLTDVVDNGDGSFDVTMETFVTDRDVLYTVTGLSASVSGSTITFTWDDYKHNATTKYQVQAVLPNGSTHEYETAALQTTLAVDTTTDSLPTGTSFRVRAVGGSHPANWSRVLDGLLAP